MIATAQDVQAAVTIAAVATAGIVIGAVWPYALALVAMALRTAGRAALRLSHSMIQLADRHAGETS